MPEHLDELLERFPRTPPGIVVKTDILLRGIRLTEDVLVFGRGHHINYFLLDDRINVLVNWRRESPYAFRLIEGGVGLFYEERQVGRASFVPVPSYLCELLRNDLAVMYSQRGHRCAYLSPASACQYFFRKQQCAFCGFNSFWEAHLRGHAPMVPDPAIFVDIVQAAIEQVGLRHVKFTGGAFYSLERETTVYAKLADALRSRTRIEALHAYPQALTRDQARRLADAGVDEVCYDVELWDEHLWPTLLPGKHATIGRAEWLRRLQDSVEVFGPGRVSTCLVAGFELVHPGGYDSAERALESNVGGFRWLVEHGIGPSFFPWTPDAPDSDAALGLTDVRLPTSYFLELGWALHEVQRELGAYAWHAPGAPRLLCPGCGYHSTSHDYPLFLENPAPPALAPEAR